MAFNITNEATLERIREIAAQTGASIDSVIDTAVSEHAQRLRSADEERVQRVMRRARRCASRLSPAVKSLSIDEVLYDDHGLPK